jgi:hypothetical protein
MIITIDGPAGAGKSSIARRVAQELGFEFLDTGAMYRAVTWGAMQREIAWDDVDALAEFADSACLVWQDDRIFLDDQDISEEIRTPQVTSHIRHLADPPRIRERISAQQRRIAAGRDIVTEGRDQGTEVFPDAHCKIFFAVGAEAGLDKGPSDFAPMPIPRPLGEAIPVPTPPVFGSRISGFGELSAAGGSGVFASGAGANFGVRTIGPGLPTGRPPSRTGATGAERSAASAGFEARPTLIADGFRPVAPLRSRTGATGAVGVSFVGGATLGFDSDFAAEPAR